MPEEHFFVIVIKKGVFMSTDNNQHNNEPDKDFLQRLEMAAQIHFLKKRIEKLEQERHDTETLLVKMWNTAITWVIPRYFNSPKE